MGQLVKGDIPSLFNGVSRQPDTVRLPSQVQACDNGDLSVVTGGATDRDPTQFIGELSALDAAEDYMMHTVDRDTSDRYHIFLSTGSSIKIYDADGVAQTVAFTAGHQASIEAYLAVGTYGAKERFAAVTILDTTVVTNREKVTAMAPGGGGVITGSYQTEADLPAAPADGSIYLVYGNSTDLDDYYVKYVTANTRYEECADPTINNAFDDTTMPFKIVRNVGGDFTVSKVTWDERGVGGAETVPEPSFIGSEIRDVLFFKNRLGFISVSNAIYSRASDFYNFWPAAAQQVLDSDPVDVVATGTRVSLLQWAVPNKKTVFIAADGGQFEQSNTTLMTPTSTGIDESTTYEAPNRCRPVNMGSELYFPSEISGSGIVYEYYFQEATFSNVADDVTKHVSGYVPSGITKMVAEGNSKTLVILSENDTDALYIYRTHWQGTEKVQSAWFRWLFDGEVLDMNFLAGELVVLIKDGTEHLLMKIAISDTTNDAGFNLRLDQKVAVTGSYSAPNTSWTIPYAHDDAVLAFKGSDWSAPGEQITLTYDVDGVTVTAPGDHSANPVIFGFTYTTRIRLSKQFRRDGQTGQVDLQGSTKIKRIKWFYQNSGAFKVEVTADGRATKTYEYTGANVGLMNSILGVITLSDGTFSHRVKSQSDTVVIELVNDNVTPFTITAASWTGFHHDNIKAG